MPKRITKIDDLVQDPHNANIGTPRAKSLLTHSLAETGAGRGALADANGVLIAGNKTVEAWAAAGGKIQIVETDGDVLVVTQRRDLDLDSPDPAVRDRSRLAAYLDNRVAELSINFDPAVLIADLETGLDLSTMFTDEEILALTAANMKVEPAALTEFGNFGVTASLDEGFVVFRFGDYNGKVEQDVYAAFVARYKQMQLLTDEPMLGDILRAWLELNDTASTALTTGDWSDEDTTDVT